MLVKEAKKIVDGMAKGLDGIALNKAVIAMGYELDGKDFTAIINEYKQHDWSDEDLTGPRKKIEKAAVDAAVRTLEGTPKKTAAKKTTRKVVTPAGKKTKGITKGERQMLLILAGKDNDAIVAAIKKEFKGAETTTSCVAWYRSKMRLGKFGPERKKAMLALDKKKNAAKK